MASARLLTLSWGWRVFQGSTYTRPLHVLTTRTKKFLSGSGYCSRTAFCLIRTNWSSVRNRPGDAFVSARAHSNRYTRVKASDTDIHEFTGVNRCYTQLTGAQSEGSCCCVPIIGLRTTTFRKSRFRFVSDISQSLWGPSQSFRLQCRWLI